MRGILPGGRSVRLGLSETLDKVEAYLLHYQPAKTMTYEDDRRRPLLLCFAEAPDSI